MTEEDAIAWFDQFEGVYSRYINDVCGGTLPAGNKTACIANANEAYQKFVVNELGSDIGVASSNFRKMAQSLYYLSRPLGWKMGYDVASNLVDLGTMVDKRFTYLGTAKTWGELGYDLYTEN